MEREKLIKKIKRGIIVYRGESPKNNHEFATDPGDFGRGIYYSSSRARAKAYSSLVIERKLRLKNPLVVCESCAYLLAESFGTLWGNIENRLENSHKLTLFLINNGYDGFISMRKRNKKIELEIVDYSPYLPDK